MQCDAMKKKYHSSTVVPRFHRSTLILPNTNSWLNVMRTCCWVCAYCLPRDRDLLWSQHSTYEHATTCSSFFE